MTTVAARHIVVGLCLGCFRVGLLRDGDVVVSHLMQPVRRILAAIPARAARCGADSQPHVPAGDGHILHHLHAGLAGANDKARAIRDI